MPKYLYRYRALNQYSISELIHGEFYFTSPSNFNDPFDCKNMFSFDGATDQHWRLFLEKYLILNQPHLTTELRKEQIGFVLATGEHREKERYALQSSWGNILAKISEKYGVVCLSSKRDDILMWSHYGDCHKGFCLAFKKEFLQAAFNCKKVTYKATYPVFGDFVNCDDDEISRSFLLTKSRHWRYENEYRLLVDPKTRVDKPDDRLYQIPPNALACVIFGCQMPEKDRQTVYELVTRKWQNIRFSEAIKSSNSYALKIKRI